MNYSRLMARLRLKEGFRRKMYLDTVGVPTIGYGRNLKKGVSKDEADLMLQNDMEEAERGVTALLSCLPHLTQVRQEVLVEMAFNLGTVGLSKFRKMLGAVEDGNFEEAARQILNSKAARQHEEWANPRYKELAHMMKEG